MAPFQCDEYDCVREVFGCAACSPVGGQRGAEKLRGLRDVVVVVGAAYRLAAGGGRGWSLHGDLLQALVLEGEHTAGSVKNSTMWPGRQHLNSYFPQK